MVIEWTTSYNTERQTGGRTDWLTDKVHKNASLQSLSRVYIIQLSFSSSTSCGWCVHRQSERPSKSQCTYLFIELSRYNAECVDWFEIAFRISLSLSLIWRIIHGIKSELLQFRIEPTAKTIVDDACDNDGQNVLIYDEPVWWSIHKRMTIIHSTIKSNCRDAFSARLETVQSRFYGQIKFKAVATD